MMVFMRLGTAFHPFVLFFLFLKDGGRAEASLGRQVANVVDDLPHFVVLENPFPSRHSGGTNTVLDDPLELPVGVLLHIFRREVGYRRGHLLSKRDTRVLAVEAVADL